MKFLRFHRVILRNETTIVYGYELHRDQLRWNHYHNFSGKVYNLSNLSSVEKVFTIVKSGHKEYAISVMNIFDVYFVNTSSRDSLIWLSLTLHSSRGTCSKEGIDAQAPRFKIRHIDKRFHFPLYLSEPVDSLDTIILMAYLLGRFQNQWLTRRVGCCLPENFFILALWMNLIDCLKALSSYCRPSRMLLWKAFWGSDCLGNTGLSVCESPGGEPV